MTTPAEKWHEEVPGARWFRADLHVHTLDDHPGNRIKRPSGMRGPPDDPKTQGAYARAFLRAAVSQGVEVLGLTPHSPRSGTGDDTSATWRIFEEWRDGLDDDGQAFREKIYAVFPGFEPSVSDGSRGVHLLFLFDPAIGRDCYLRAFQVVMGGAAPWNGTQLRMSTLSAKEVFEKLDSLRHEEEKQGRVWNYICLAPHAFDSQRGLFSIKSQVLEHFPHSRIAALELGDNQLPEDELEQTGRGWLKEGMAKYRQAFFHSSDAYSLAPDDEGTSLFRIGSRTTLIKLGAPRIESLRQAFLAHDSRIRLCHRREGESEDHLISRDDLPEASPVRRPWLHRVTVVGGTSFFGGTKAHGEAERETSFNLSPDLTCVIGGRMSGKSTFLDGLRVEGGHDLPMLPQVRSDVEARARDRFLSGAPRIALTLHGPVNPTLPSVKRWPAKFFTQRELQDAIRDPGALRDLLFRLMPGRTETLVAQNSQLEVQDARLAALSKELRETRAELGEVDQAFSDAKASKDALDRIARTDAHALGPAQGDVALIRQFQGEVSTLKVTVEAAARSGRSASVPTGLSELGQLAWPLAERTEATEKIRLVIEVLGTAVKLAGNLEEAVKKALTAASQREQGLRAEVQAALVAGGGSAEELNHFQALSKGAAEHEGAKLRLEAVRKRFQEAQQRFTETVEARARAVAEHREAMRTVAAAIARRFDGRIRVKVVKEGDRAPLENWLHGLREKGLTRWWNSSLAADVTVVGVERLLAAHNQSRLVDIGMSDQVKATFAECMTEDRVLELTSMRCADSYALELRVDDIKGEYRELSELSGGQQVSLVLTLLLESDDPAPLIIDQPEDELDNAYLFSTVLPALRRLKGQRQIIFATHNANIVVNGDADQVIVLEANANQGWVANEGPIENQGVKEAILRTLDGGREAFQLRQVKYGF